MIEVDGNLVQAFTRLPDKSDARYFRMAGMESKTTSPLQLSEIVSDNVSGPQAADESHPDWIELVNTSDQPIAIGGAARIGRFAQRQVGPVAGRIVDLRCLVLRAVDQPVS